MIITCWREEEVARVVLEPAAAVAVAEGRPNTFRSPTCPGFVWRLNLWCREKHNSWICLRILIRAPEIFYLPHFIFTVFSVNETRRSFWSMFT